MSNDRRPLVRFTLRRDSVTHSIMSIWAGKFPGTYDISRDKGSDKFPAIGLFDALKSWGGGNGFLGFSVESQREQRNGAARTGQQQGNGFGGGTGGGDQGGVDFGDDDIPFAPFDHRRA